jgi:spermidine synthase
VDVDEYLRLSKDSATLRYSTRDADTLIEVHEHDGDRWVYTHDRSILSMMRLDAPADPVMPNHIAMLAALLFRELPDSVLNLGFGTGAFERFFGDRLPHTRVVSVDTSATLVEVARAHFRIGQDWPVIIQSAGDFLRTNTQLFDFVLCDIFNGDSHPDCLYDAGFHADAARSLEPGGVMALNLSPATERELLDILVPIRKNFANVLLVNLVDYGNVVLFAMQHPPADIGEQSKRAQLLGTRLRLDLQHIPERITILPPVTPGITDLQTGENA